MQSHKATKPAPDVVSKDGADGVTIPWSIESLLLALAYFALARLGLLLVLPSGFSTVFWPAAGVALCAVIWRGNKMLPGIVLGSFAGNALNIDPTQGLFLGLGATFLIAVGAALQAAIGAHVVKRFIGADTQLETLREALLLIVVGGPLACLISTSIANSVLVFAGQVPVEHVALSWLTWWVGDSLGVLVVCPTLILAARPLALVSIRRKTTVAAVMCTLLMATIMVFEWSRQKNEETLLAEHIRYSAELKHHMQDRFNALESLLHSVRSGFRISDHISRNEFAQLEKEMQFQNGALAGLYYFPSDGSDVVSGSPRPPSSSGIDLAIDELFASARYHNGIASFVDAAGLWLSLHVMAPKSEGMLLAQFDRAKLKDIFTQSIPSSPLQVAVRSGDGSWLLPEILADGKRISAPIEQSLRLGSEQWTITTQLDKHYESAVMAANLPLILIGGLMIVGSVGLLVVVLSGQISVVEHQSAMQRRNIENLNIHKTRFLSNMSKDLRTPVAEILGLARRQRAAVAPRLTASELQYYDRIEQNGQKLLRTIEDILHMSLLDGKRTAVEPVQFNLHTLLNELELRYQRQCHLKGIQLRIDYRCEDIELHNDLAKLQQILSRLLENAVRYTYQGSIQLEVKRHGEGSPEQRLGFTLSDTGEGITKNRLRQLFEINTEDTEQTDNQGLGLLICRKLVELLNGSIRIESELGTGTSVYVSIPLQYRELHLVDMSSEGAAAIGIETGPNPRSY